MDTLRVLRQKVARLSRDKEYPGVSAVLRHIEVAESYFQRAIDGNEPDMFTDVIYRTNHAFEGILKEAYAVLERKDADKKTPNEIEQYLANSDVFKPRVMELFRNYRTQWRNPSTHDYQLLFNEQEAYLSILSMSSFVSILLDQIIEKEAFEMQRAEAKPKAAELTAGIENFASLGLAEKAASLLLSFSLELKPQLQRTERLTELEVHGMLRGFLNSVAPGINAYSEPYLKEGMRPDLLLESGGEKVILEMRSGRTKRDREYGLHQLLVYLEASGATTGILYHFPTSPEQALVQSVHKFEVGGTERTVITIEPEVRGPSTS